MSDLKLVESIRRTKSYQDDDVPVRVEGPGDADPLFLSTAQVDALLSDLRHVLPGQHVDVGLEGARVDDLAVSRTNQEKWFKLFKSITEWGDETFRVSMKNKCFMKGNIIGLTVKCRNCLGTNLLLCERHKLWIAKG